MGADEPLTEFIDPSPRQPAACCSCGAPCVADLQQAIRKRAAANFL